MKNNSTAHNESTNSLYNILVSIFMDSLGTLGEKGYIILRTYSLLLMSFRMID